MARSFGVENHEISDKEVANLFPLAYTDDIDRAFYFPEDGRVNPADVTQALAKGARKSGVNIIEDCEVTSLIKSQGTVRGVETQFGVINAETVVLCPGMWGYEIGKKVGVNLPLHAAEHYYLISEAIEGANNKLPILRDPERNSYAREETGKILLGFFEPNAAAWGKKGIPKNFCFDEIQPDWERMEPHIERGMERIPAMMNVARAAFGMRISQE